MTSSGRYILEITSLICILSLDLLVNNMKFESQFLPSGPIEGQDPPDALAAIVFTRRHVLEGKDHLFVDDGVVVPEALTNREGECVDIFDRGGPRVLDLQDVGLLVACVVFVVAPQHHDLLLCDLDCS